MFKRLMFAGAAICAVAGAEVMATPAYADVRCYGPIYGETRTRTTLGGATGATQAPLEGDSPFSNVVRPRGAIKFEFTCGNKSFRHIDGAAGDPAAPLGLAVPVN